MERQNTLNAQENKRLTQLQSPYYIHSQHNSSHDKNRSDKSTLHFNKEQTLQSVEDFKNFFSAQVSGLPSGSGSRISQPVPTDYHNKTVTNLPKIKQLLQTKQIDKGSTPSFEATQNQQQNFIYTKQALKTDFQDSKIPTKILRQSFDRSKVVENNRDQDQNTKNNFYSTFNFKVMHSRSTDFMEEDQINQSRLQMKQFGGVHNAGGTQYKNWNYQSSQENYMTSYPQFQVAKYRNIPTNASALLKIEQDACQVKLSSQFRLNRFEQFSVDRAFANKTQQLQFSDLNLDDPTKNFLNQQWRDISPEKDFNFKRKKNKNYKNEQNKYDKASIFTSMILNDSTEPSVLQQQTTFNPKDSVFGTSTLLSREIYNVQKNQSQQISNIMVSTDIPQKVQIKCKVQLQRQIDNSHTVQPTILQNLLRKQNHIQNSQDKESEVTKKLLNRENTLKQRPAKLRQLSAQQKRQMLAQTLHSNGFKLDENISDDQSDQSTEQTSKIAENSEIHNENKQRLMNYSTTQFNSTLSRATIPRLTQISMIQESKNFNVLLAHQQFQHLFNACSTGQERALINDAYKHFHSEVRESIEQNQQLKEIQVGVKSESDSSFSDSGQEELDWQHDNEDLKFKKIMRVVKKGLVKYRQILQKNLDTLSMKSKVESLDIKYVQQQVEETARQRRKNLPLQGDDLYLAALRRVREIMDKFGRIKFDNKAGIRNYTHLLEATNQVDYYGIENHQEEQKIRIPQIHSLDSARSHTSVQKLGKIKRGFLIMPNSLDIEQVDIEEIIDDPEIMFENYLQRVKNDKNSAGMDFLHKFEDQRISGIYNFNSTIYEKNPTSRVAYFTACKRQVELALPVLSKIKNQELVLTDYRLDSGHFEALGISFKIEPEIVTRISLINCGLDEAATTSLFKAVKSLKCIEYLSLCKTDLSHESVIQLKDLVTNSGGWGLQELKLKDVKMNPLVAEYFFKMLTERSYLKTLALVNYNFTEKTFSYFTEYFRINQALRNLDISYASGIRPKNYVKFFEVLAHNKLLNSLNLSWNNFIEDQPAAFLELQNPYKVFKAMYEKWIKMGPGARWPGKPDPKTPANCSQKSPKRQAKPTPKGGRMIITIPEFEIVDKTDEVPEKLKIDEEENFQSQMKADQEKEIARIVKQCILFAFQKRMIKKPDPKALKNKQESEETKLDQSEYKELELVSAQALMVTEAIYKFIRRNQRLQHLNLTRCNLGQVMLGRIGQGVKCSKTLMGVHFSENPGVTPALKAFLQVKMKAKPPQVSHDKINNAFIDKPANLDHELKQQLVDLKTEIYLAHETVLLKEQGKKSSDVYLPSDPSLCQSKTLVFTRLLGHKLQIPDSGRWKILTQPQEDCWICKKYVVSLFFWNKQIGSHQIPEHVISKDGLLSEIKKTSQVGNPFIYGHFNQWNPAMMMKVSDFALLHRTKKKPNFLQIIVKKFNLGPGFETVHDLKPEHKTLFTQLQYNYENDPTINWRRYIAAMSRFQEPCLVNYEYFNQESFDQAECSETFNDLDSNPLYVYAALVKPGKHHFLIQHNQEAQKVRASKFGSPHSYTSGSLSQEFSSHNVSQQQFQTDDLLSNLDQSQSKIPKKVVEQFYLHRSIIPQRSEEIPVMYKAFVEQVAVRQFFHRLSVFAPWKPDNAQIINKCVENDMLAMNLDKYLKEAEDIARMEKVIKKYLPYLKDVHIDLVCESDFPPFITFLDFMNFTQTCKFASDGLKQASIELIYVQVDTNVKARNGIIRGEFLEALIRVAKAKYVDTGIEKRLDVALEKLVESLIKPNWPADRWQKLRDKKFWNNEVNDILQVNLEGLKMLHRKFWDLKALPKKKFMLLKECESLLLETKLKINLKTIRRSFIMAKMTCSDERTKIDSYNKLQFVEFLEFLCRVALDYEDANLGNTTNANIQKRLEVVLDEALAYIGLQRREVVMETFMDSDADLSDDEY